MKDNANGLMGDLESIKVLLEEEDALPAWDMAAEPVQEISPEIPVLETRVPEDEYFETTPLTTPDISATPNTAASLEALLGAEFHDATDNVMARARGMIEQHPNQWTPQQTDELSDALRVRIDDAVKEWIRISLAKHADELQQQLLNAVRDELARHLEAFDTAADSKHP